MHILIVIIGQSNDSLSYGLCENPGCRHKYWDAWTLTYSGAFSFTTFQ